MCAVKKIINKKYFNDFNVPPFSFTLYENL